MTCAALNPTEIPLTLMPKTSPNGAASVTVRSDRSAGFWGCRLVCTKDSGHLWCLNDASDKAALDG